MKTMHSGVPEYFCNVKSSKTKISFECHLNEKDVTKMNGGRLAWCGLLIDTGSYEILGDYENTNGTIEICYFKRIHGS